jgi:ABC-2 type transport system ATP-binding protein
MLAAHAAAVAAARADCGTHPPTLYMEETRMTPPTTGGADAALRTRNLTKAYGQRAAVRQLNLAVRRGEIFGFLGPNGAGKTTTIRMLLGLITPTSGAVEAFGQPVATRRATVLPRIGALVETPALYPYLTGRGNLLAMGALTQVPAARIDAALDLVGLTGRQHDRVRTYSLGMQQRLGIAIAVLHDPDLLILDEPANGLDPAGIVEMRDLMRQLAAQGKTIFISSHVLAEVQQLCTRVAIINLGELVTEATIDELTHGDGEFVAQVEQRDAALTLLRQQSWGQTARLDPAGHIITPSPDGRGQSLYRFLADAGYVPDALTPYAERLEDVFLRLTGATEGDTRR